MFFFTANRLVCKKYYMPAQMHFDVELVARALEESRGIIKRAAKKLDIPRTTLNRWIRASSTLRAALSEGREDLLDDLEDTVSRKALAESDEGDLNACIFMLKAHGKERGYSDRQEKPDAMSMIREFLVGVKSAAELEDERQYPMAKAYRPKELKHPDLPPDGEKAAIEADHPFKPKKKK